MRDQAVMQDNTVKNVDVLLFDLGGTVFDWQTAIVDAFKLVDANGESGIDPLEFAQAWRKQSLIRLESIANGESPWRPFDQILQTTLDTTLLAMGAAAMSLLDRVQLIAAWDAMPAWPGVAESLQRLRKRYFIAPHTILSLRATAYSSKAAGIDWDAIISCDALQSVKLDPESYRLALLTLGKSAEQVCFVASHPSDLRAAQRLGMRTAYVVARLEDYGDRYDESGYDEEFDLVAEDFTELADKLGCD